MTEAHDTRSQPSHDAVASQRSAERGSPIAYPPSASRSTLLADVATAIALAVFVAGMCLALIWIEPFELVPPRLR